MLVSFYFRASVSFLLHFVRIYMVANSPMLDQSQYRARENTVTFYQAHNYTHVPVLV